MVAMYKVIVNSITIGRRTFVKNSELKEGFVGAKMLIELEKAKKIEKITVKSDKKKDG
jgi:hypothetical protein